LTNFVKKLDIKINHNNNGEDSWFWKVLRPIKSYTYEFIYTFLCCIPKPFNFFVNYGRNWFVESTPGLQLPTQYLITAETATPSQRASLSVLVPKPLTRGQSYDLCIYNYNNIIVNNGLERFIKEE
jgi:hypothetical protein